MASTRADGAAASGLDVEAGVGGGARSDEGAGAGQYQLAMAALAEPLTAPTVRPREALRRLDIVGLRLSDADRLATAASKRGT